MNWNKLLPSAYLLIGLGEIIGEVYHVEALIYLFKPILMPCLLAFLWINRANSIRITLAGAMVALIMSWFGDVFLMLDPTFFILGLGSFLIAQVSYMVAYSRALVGPARDIFSQWHSYLILILLLGYGIFLVLRIEPELGDKLIPVIIYALSLLGMVFLAFLRNGRTSRLSYLLVYSGALIFLVSDSMIAVSQFESPFWFDRYWIMLTYILAQFLIINGLIAHFRFVN